MPTSPDARDHPTAVFYGDSVSTGWSGTTAPRARWTSLVSDALGWREVTLAMDGMGWFRWRGPRDARGERTSSATDTTLLDAAVRLAPDVVVVCLAVNDVGFVDTHAEQVRSSIRRDLTRLRDGLPGRPVVVATYFPTAELSPPAGRLHDWVSGTAAALGMAYVDGFRRAVDGDPDLLCDDLVHPNDAGHAALAAAILPTLRGLDL